MNNLVGYPPNQVLLHGPSKLLVDRYHWHMPETGIIGSYTPRAKDVEDHFGVFRGVDQIESFGQATVGSCAPFLESLKQNCSMEDLRGKYIPTFIGVGQVSFHSYLQEGETFVSIGHIKFYKFRQMVVDGRIYKAPGELDLDGYFRDFTADQVRNYGLDNGFTLVAEFYDIAGRAIKASKI